MKKELDEKKLIEGLKLGREMVKSAQKTSEMALAIAYKYQQIAARTYDPENMRLLCEALDVEWPSGKHEFTAEPENKVT